MNLFNNKWVLILGILCIIAGNLSSQILPPVCTPSPGVFTQKPCVQVNDIVTNATFCQGDIYSWNNSNYSAAGIYTVPATDQYGCSFNQILNLSLALSGCTDPLADNYNPNAVCDDGTCIAACPVDLDGDGVCADVDCNDNDPGLPTIPGTACNDGNPTTINDVIGADGCSCIGTMVDPCAGQGGDSDGDGICDSQDCQPNDPAFPATPGTPCDDGNPNTEFDVIGPDGCLCAGTIVNVCIEDLDFDGICDDVDTCIDIDADGSCQPDDCDDNDASSVPQAPGTVCNGTGQIGNDGCTCIQF